MTDLFNLQPAPGVSPCVAMKNFFSKSFEMKGRASRSEYWWPTLILTGGLAACDIAARHYDRAKHPEAYAANPGALERLVPIVRVPAPGAAETEAEKEARKQHSDRLAETSLLFSLPLVEATAAPSFTVSVRRLHDINLSGHWLWLNAIPVAGNLGSLVLSALPGKPEGRRFDS